MGKKILYRMLLILSFLPIILCVVGIINSYEYGYGGYEFFGVTIGEFYGFEAVCKYLYIIFSPKFLGIIFIPIYISCFIYQIIYFKKLRKL